MRSNDNKEWDIIIEPKRHNFFTHKDIKEIIEHRDLILNLVNRDFITQYKQTILGPFWYFIQPLLTTIVFTVIFGNIVKISTDGLPKPLFYLAGIIIWNFFSSTLSTTSNIFINNSHIFGKVYFPRLVIPISIIISNYIKLFIQLVLFLSLYLYLIFLSKGIKPNLYLIFTPFIFIQLSLLGGSCGMIISSLTTKYRDLQFLVNFGIQLWMYATPVVYPLSLIPQKWQWIFFVNPVSFSVELFRYSLTGYGSSKFLYFLISFFLTLILFFISVIYFKKAEQTFIDRV